MVIHFNVTFLMIRNFKLTQRKTKNRKLKTILKNVFMYDAFPKHLALPGDTSQQPGFLGGLQTQVKCIS